MKPELAIIVEPQNLRGFGVITEIAHHYKRARNTNFAFLANRLLLERVIFNNLKISIRERYADNAILKGIFRRETNRARTFGKTIANPDFGV